MSHTETLQVPDFAKLSAVQRLCEVENPYRVGRAERALFVDAMNQSIAWHSKRSQFYRRLLAERRFSIGGLRRYEDCGRVPFVLANFFKRHEAVSIPKSDVFLNFTSSGTTGQKSQIFYDRWSFRSGQRMVDRMFEWHGWVSPDEAANYLLYSYEVDSDSKLGTAYTDQYLCKYAPIKSVFKALRRTGTGNHEFDVFGCIERLRQYEREGLPVRIFGFPAFLYFTLKRMKDLQVPALKLNERSLVFLGGGWKGHAGEAISKKELYSEVTRVLGIPDKRIRDGFGAVEHPIPYVECERHQFHVPVWSQVYIRDVKTLAVLPLGKKGLLHFVSPFITSMPAHSVLMGDLASLHPGSACRCSIETPYFVIHGRAGTSKNRSCAIAAAELLSK